MVDLVLLRGLEPVQVFLVKGCHFRIAHLHIRNHLLTDDRLLQHLFFEFGFEQVHCQPLHIQRGVEHLLGRKLLQDFLDLLLQQFGFNANILLVGLLINQFLIHQAGQRLMGKLGHLFFRKSLVLLPVHQAIDLDLADQQLRIQRDPVDHSDLVGNGFPVDLERLRGSSGRQRESEYQAQGQRALKGRHQVHQVLIPFHLQAAVRSTIDPSAPTPRCF